MPTKFAIIRGTDYTKKLIDAIPEGKLEDIKKHLESKGVKVS